MRLPAFPIFTHSASSLAYKHRVFPGPLPPDGFPQYSAPYLSPVSSSSRPAVYALYHAQASVGSGEPSPVELGELRMHACVCAGRQIACHRKGSPEHVSNENMSSEAIDHTKMSNPVDSEPSILFVTR